MDTINLIYYIFVIKDIVVKIAKINNQEMHGENAEFCTFLILPYSRLFSSGKYIRLFYHYLLVTK